MSPNRKADLQRKLAMAPIPKPPAGLAERIKSDIPQHLLVDVRQERERFSRSIAFNLRVAASVILLIGSVYLALHVMTRSEVDKTAVELPSNVVVAPRVQPQVSAGAPARVAETPAPTAPAVMPKTLPPQQATAAAPKRMHAYDEEKNAGRAADASPAESITVAEAPPPPPALAAPVPEPPPVAVADANSGYAGGAAAPRPAAKTASPGFMAEANAAPLTLAPATLFDVVVPRDGAMLEGQQLIQHFAAPASSPRSLRVETETAAFQEKTLLRVSIDTPYAGHPEGGSLPPVAAEATLDVKFDDGAVASHRALSGTTHGIEPALPSSTSVTALYDVELKPGVDDAATLAVVTLRYHSVADGEEHAVTRKLRVSDIRAWRYASKRMKGASLGAALVYGFAPAETIAERARAAGLEELAGIAEKR